MNKRCRPAPRCFHGAFDLVCTDFIHAIYLTMVPTIGLVLRHQGIDTTYYAKADVTLLKQIAQPCPE